MNEYADAAPLDTSGGGCCGLESGRTATRPPDAARAKRATRQLDAVATADIPGGRAAVGTDAPFLPADGEGPKRFVQLKPYALDVEAVTVCRFSRFVRETGYVTDAERFGWSFVFHRHVRGDPAHLQWSRDAHWWRRVDGACWRAPEGPGSSVGERMDHPVVHVSARDSDAFAAWAGGRLPNEAEWEHAARGGLRDALFPWGNDEPTDHGPYPCNIWQGRFPARDEASDGYDGTAPVRSFEPNGYGLYQMCGNVWEWTADPFRVRSLKREAKELNTAAALEGRRVLKGGSFLCHRSYCYRYRIAARTGNTPDTSTSHTGFRLAYDRA